MKKLFLMLSILAISLHASTIKSATHTTPKKYFLIGCRYAASATKFDILPAPDDENNQEAFNHTIKTWADDIKTWTEDKESNRVFRSIQHASGNWEEIEKNDDIPSSFAYRTFTLDELKELFKDKNPNLDNHALLLHLADFISSGDPRDAYEELYRAYEALVTNQRGPVTPYPWGIIVFYQCGEKDSDDFKEPLFACIPVSKQKNKKIHQEAIEKWYKHLKDTCGDSGNTNYAFKCISTDKKWTSICKDANSEEIDLEKLDKFDCATLSKKQLLAYLQADNMPIDSEINLVLDLLNQHPDIFTDIDSNPDPKAAFKAMRVQLLTCINKELTDQIDDDDDEVDDNVLNTKYFLTYCEDDASRVKFGVLLAPDEEDAFIKTIKDWANSIKGSHSLRAFDTSHKWNEPGSYDQGSYSFKTSFEYETFTLHQLLIYFKDENTPGTNIELIKDSDINKTYGFQFLKDQQSYKNMRSLMYPQLSALANTDKHDNDKNGKGDSDASSKGDGSNSTWSKAPWLIGGTCTCVILVGGYWLYTKSKPSSTKRV